MMRRYAWMVLAAAILCTAAGQAWALDVSGSWATRGEFKDTIQLNQRGNSVTGTYPQDLGEIIGEMFGSRFQGFWIEDQANRRCPIPLNGRYYWGSITMDYAGDGLTGVWGYCFDTPTRRFDGQRGGMTGSMPAMVHARISGVWKTTEGNMSLNVRDGNVTGTYTTDNGEIMGQIQGNTLTGYWIENHSDRRCSAPKNGRYYWGQIRFVFTGDKFEGVWGYCEDQPGRSWKGNR